MRGTFPPAVVRFPKSGKPIVEDGNHRVHYWREHGVTHVPAWIVDERPRR
jgi:hypothetical protein